MDNITEWDPEKECVQYTSGPAYNILGVNHVHTQEREQELAKVEELYKDICDLMMDDVLHVSSDSWTEAVKKIALLYKTTEIAIKAQYKQ